ncbi:hypothetical protein A2331_01390 [Candidatus Falkowbacteria bacterium RIFOXYB2_FULL_34_18]|uniref:PSP1 C-terminal domain-containing protein n=1 Tax=Candidatus Falkowbacteria bacterium RIFOXYD2_FULL_34_120 TaxID=1798007 RepID=A0A1F5TPJ3_9BACT|nr:MAG: hypothetical protein A2331_01390 [Candidatus Falkowbacteria bacterium RIFOXYB2_FULL_34_18]OGF29269.1 MAG: hypothetical protein A2500_05270 [Candidatus Falkowbacteria bacterium RIFOXYC12_FULL_34_55]OGF36385.1 MAG: hypothetical protein A2466_00930 [Candidatus Falkowbacteria bacterium RIFOXYC2_FULL_34_220]OGF38864.1 MAG: hypothetical protein A2515_05690 [Candidatus Falkowbacteria bacterium RIFOXYD12_FULL_34_57]OGF40883.1 MAG: hypothetical protein A2531_03915 [Candidatus Falkowbacteria bact
MQIAQIQFSSWDKVYNFSFSDDLNVEINDSVVVKTELGMEIGVVVCILSEKEIKEAKEDFDISKIKPILRIATVNDLEKLPKQDEKDKALVFCKKVKDKFNLSMKFIGVHFSFDGSRITFAFIADGRVDFRELVKELTRHFGRTIRLQQIGIRDEAKIMGDYGHCGKELCCRGHLKNLCSITSEMAEIQQCAHRGSERISGICGRLMCCLAYEQCGYEQLAQKLPPMGIKVNVDGKRGVIVGHHILKQSVDVQFDKDKKGEGGAVVEIDLNRHKK